MNQEWDSFSFGLYISMLTDFQLLYYSNVWQETGGDRQVGLTKRYTLYGIDRVSRVFQGHFQGVFGVCYW